MTYKSLPRNTIIKGDALEQLRTLPDDSIDCCLTSPPYYGLREYGTATWEGGNENCEHFIMGDGESAGEKQQTNSGSLRLKAKDICPHCGAKRIDHQLGLEVTPELYIEKLVNVFREVRRILKPTGIAWLNLGDSYVGSNCGYGQTKDSTGFQNVLKQTYYPTSTRKPITAKVLGLKPKNLLGIPWRVAFALQQDGWILRKDIIWAKGLSFCPTYSGSTMPESVKTRPSTSHEYVFMLVKSHKYYYDYYGVREDASPVGISRYKRAISDNHKYTDGAQGQRRHTINLQRTNNPNREAPDKRNLRSVWTVNPAASSDAHFAVMPKKLVVPMISASTSEHGNCVECGSPWERVVEAGDSTRQSGDGEAIDSRFFPSKGAYHGRLGERITEIVDWQATCNCKTAETVPAVVLDPFMGSGTTALVAQQLHRDYVGIELNAEYITMAASKLAQLNLFSQKTTVNS